MQASSNIRLAGKVIREFSYNVLWMYCTGYFGYIVGTAASAVGF